MRPAHDDWEDRPVLAVGLPARGDEGAVALARVVRDVRRAGGAAHPGLAAALDVAVDVDRRVWLVHPAIAGARTPSEVRAAGPVAPATLLGWAVDVAGALLAAHGCRLVHGRITDGVVLVDDRGAAHLLGAASGLRPDDRAGAEDDDARALAVTLLAAAGADDDGADVPGAGLRAVLTAVAGGHPPPGEDAAPGGLTAALDRALGRLGHPGHAPEDGRRTEVVRTPVAVTTAPVRTAPARTAPVVTAYLGPAPHPAATTLLPGVAPWPGGPGAGTVGPGPPVRRRRRTALVLLGVVVALAVVAGLVALVVLAAVGRTSGPGPPVTGPGERIVPVVVTGPPDHRDPSAPRGGRAMTPIRTAR